MMIIVGEAWFITWKKRGKKRFTARQKTEINGRNNCSSGVDMSSVNNQVKRVMGNSAQLNEQWSSGMPRPIRASWG